MSTYKLLISVIYTLQTSTDAVHTEAPFGCGLGIKCGHTFALAS